ncbi:MAG: (Na+)-NQR maturation NqrM [Candidatus Marinimicrobia bacterium]|nr:(Na+)-NQR maturation NqrM [Candidatus Neomarinimicrobiota bacterium]MBT4753485.1 (Na+)-NQR maturation NqrM [Candidatus Neomarinimicrobiota bacterium]MBT5115091.1 (Na+)-NQR maturation NqrM [Candidatus Neomarinimicrobiota bacterium]MBT5748335.1 (Na+)-NQR maturation NqrM [Candidatus Neomarinimicrobiota bacterium]MBT6412743.1 (Na+)-NQR maturation NqrM [Candidatus Neomarinimicrobiota bacterium]
MIAISGMAIGVIFNNKPLSGSCGGLNPNGVCSLCGGNPENCDNDKSTFSTE